MTIPAKLGLDSVSPKTVTHMAIDMICTKW